MSWAARRRFIILLIVGTFAVAFLALVLISTFYKTPSCSDGVQNQDEAGVDCGGPCAYLCTDLEKPPAVLFTNVLETSGRTDIIALVENKNIDAAAKNVKYDISLYGEGQIFLQKIIGTTDLPPRTTVPIYIPGITAGNQKIVSAFLNIEAPSPQWFHLSADSITLPTVMNTAQTGTPKAPRIQAILANPTGIKMFNVQVIVLVRDINKNIIAASRTVMPVIPAQESATAIFTWNEAFPGVPASIEVAPIPQMP
jgi:hypothetical protein